MSLRSRLKPVRIKDSLNYDTNYANDMQPARRIQSNAESFSLFYGFPAGGTYHIDKDYYSDKQE